MGKIVSIIDVAHYKFIEFSSGVLTNMKRMGYYSIWQLVTTYINGGKLFR